jgi:hypothetical protein
VDYPNAAFLLELDNLNRCARDSAFYRIALEQFDNARDNVHAALNRKTYDAYGIVGINQIFMENLPIGSTFYGLSILTEKKTWSEKSRKLSYLEHNCKMADRIEIKRIFVFKDPKKVKKMRDTMKLLSEKTDVYWILRKTLDDANIFTDDFSISDGDMETVISMPKHDSNDPNLVRIIMDENRKEELKEKWNKILALPECNQL